MKQSDAIQEDVVLQEMPISMPEQARARSMDQQEQPFKLISDAITVLSSALVSLKSQDNIKLLWTCGPLVISFAQHPY